MMEDSIQHQAIHYAVKNLVALLCAKGIPHAIVIQDATTGIVQTHAYTPVDSSIAIHNEVEIRIQDRRQAS